MRGPILPPDLEELVGQGREPEDLEWFDSIDIAHCLNIHPRTVQRWIRSGKLGAHRLGNPRSRWRVSAASFERAIWAAAYRVDRRMLSRFFAFASR